MTARTTSFHDTTPSGTTPAYDFVARPKSVVPGSSPNFASVPVSLEPPAVLAAGYVPDKPPGLSRGQKSVVSALLLVVLAALVYVGGSAGWHAYQDHRRQAIVASTHIVLPDTVVGMTKRGGALQAQVDRLVSQIQTPSPTQGAAYVATKSRVALVLAGTFPMSDADQKDFLTGVGEAARVSGLTLAPVDAGSLGGQLLCGTAPRGSQTMCAFTDVAAYGVLVVPGQAQAAVDTARAFRAAVERRS